MSIERARHQFEFIIDYLAKGHPCAQMAERGLEALAVALAPAQPMDIYALAAHLPADVNWGEPITPDMVRHILSYAAAQLAAPAAPAEVRCESCGGNDADMPCAYPGEGKPGCLRDARLADQPETWKVLPSSIPAAETHVCPACLGTPSRPVVAFMNTGEDWTQHYQKEVDFQCQVCSATGKVSDEVNRRYYAGRLHRHVRAQRGESMRDAAIRLGVTVPQLSAWELGYANLPAGELKQEAKE